MAADRPPPPAALTIAEQDVVLRNRIANQEKGLKTLLRRLTAIAGSKSGDAFARELASFTMELETLVLGLARTEAVSQQTCVQEVETYKRLVTSVQQERRDAIDNIENLKRELIDVQQDRQNKLEYDALASEIMKVGTRTDLEAQLASLREAIDTLTNESRKYSEIMTASQDRFEGIASQLETLRADVGFEVGERERRAVERDGAEGEQDGADGTQSGDEGDDKKKAGKTDEHGEADGDEESDAHARPSASRQSSTRRGLNPAASAFQPGMGLEARSVEGSSRASTPGALTSSIPSKRTRASRRGAAEGETTSRKRTTRGAASKDTDTPMQALGEEDEEEEEGAA